MEERESEIVPVQRPEWDPPFFSTLNSTTDWREFEKGVFALIKLLGIHRAYRFPFENQKGKPDGFFRFGNLAVLYDCTLEASYQRSKETQMDNYCNQLKRGILNLDNRKFDFKSCEKYVWIVTHSAKADFRRQFDEVMIKEVSVQKLIELFRERLLAEIDEKDLEKRLADI